MTIKRIKQLSDELIQALERLDEALNEDLEKGSIVIDGTIQRFEFTFELAWKLAQKILSFNGVSAGSPRAIIKECFSQGIFKDGDGWIDMLEDRNKTSHLYDEAQAKIIFDRIKENHFSLLKTFCQTALDHIQDKS